LAERERGGIEGAFRYFSDEVQRLAKEGRTLVTVTTQFGFQRRVKILFEVALH
jgi:hypothetical protein